MLNSIVTKLEIDVMQGTELQEAIELAMIHKMPSIVVHPELARDAIILRGVRQGRFKIITAVDWPKGEKYGIAKLQDMPIDALSTDGFEILLSGTTKESEVKAEIQTVTDFIRMHLLEVIEIRVVLGAFMRDMDYVRLVCGCLKRVTAPAMVRTDHHLRIQQQVANVQSHLALCEEIRALTPRAIKVSGNINSAKAAISCQANRYAVSLKQANNLIREIKQSPEKIRKLLEDVKNVKESNPA